MNIDPHKKQLMHVAKRHHIAGQLDAAEAAYRQVLQLDPLHIDALHLLGLIASQTGRGDLAVELIRRALALQPNFAAAESNLGHILRINGDVDGAIAACRRAVALKADLPEAHCNLGNALKDKGDSSGAITAYRAAIALRGDYAEAHNNLGVVLDEIKDFDGAEAVCRRAISVRPDYADAHCNLGNVLKNKGDGVGAIAAYRAAISLRPDNAAAYCNMGIALKDAGDIEGAVAATQRAIALRVDYPEAHNNLGLILSELGNLEGAILMYRRAIALRPDYAEAYSNLSNALRKRGDIDEAIAASRHAIALKKDFLEARNNLVASLIDKGNLDEGANVAREIIRLRPDFPQAHLNLSHLLLLMGELREGWTEYEWRWGVKGNPPRRDFPQSEWDGRDLGGQTILLHADQGFGDTLQFVRYVPLVAVRSGKVVVECQEQLKRLLEQQGHDYSIVARGEQLPEFDVHCPLLSLPRLFSTTLETIPREVPYLRADGELSDAWRKRLARDGEFLRVGLVWAGRPTHWNDRHRSLALSALAPLGDPERFRFYSLQKGEASSQSKAPPPGLKLLDYTRDLEDFADTAALISALDLVITVDTSVAHLAGALGKKVWVLLPFSPDWRWMRDRSDSPWYPTMRLFRQAEPGGWERELDRVRQALLGWSAASGK